MGGASKNMGKAEIAQGNLCQNLVLSGSLTVFIQITSLRKCDYV